MSLTSATCGTFAWFTYATHADITYRGVSVGSPDLQIGYLSNVRFDRYLEGKYPELIEEATKDDKYIYWFSGDINREILDELLYINGYSFDTLFPVTSGHYYKGDTSNDFCLYDIPLQGGHYEEKDKAMRSKYVSLPLVFRAEDIIHPGTYFPNMNIYLSTANITPTNLDDGVHMEEAVRIYTNDQVHENTHLISPTSYFDGETVVGGVLNLNQDDYYDTYIEKVGDEEIEKEIFYGESMMGCIYEDAPLSEDQGEYVEITTFDAKHKAGVYKVDVNASKPLIAEYEGVEKHKGLITPIANTGERYAFVTLDIFVEGWDKSVIDNDFGMQFGMQLEFKTVNN